MKAMILSSISDINITMNRWHCLTCLTRSPLIMSFLWKNIPGIWFMNIPV